MSTVSTVSTRSARTVKPDAACVAAVDLAREAAAEVAAPDEVGEYLGHEVEPEADRLITHYFASTSPGYVGWRWAVTVARAARSKVVTVDEVVLLPGADALLAPPWVPWSERIRPEDMAPGTLLPTAPDDERLVPSYTDVSPDDPEALREDLRRVTDEFGLGRPRVLSAEGRAAAAERWYAGPGGPDDPVAKAAPAHCSTCGFLVRVSGELGKLFGVCANEYSPSDGQVVSFDHGCGAHSEVITVDASEPADGPQPVLDTMGYDDFDGGSGADEVGEAGGAEGAGTA